MQKLSPVELEDMSCPMGCLRDDEQVLVGQDRQNGLPGEFEIVQCRQCGLMRTNPRPTRKSIAFYYPDTYGPYSSPTLAPPGKEAKNWLREWLLTDNRKIPPMRPGRLLEIGCANGGYLQGMREQGWDVEGIEFSSKAAAKGIARGLKIHVGGVETFPPPKIKYDLIVGWMVLEHLHDPVATLGELRKWVNPDGWLVLSIPDAGSREFRRFGDAWYALQLPNHLFHFSVTTARRTLASSGWQVEKIHWHKNANNLLQSLRYRAEETGRPAIAAYLLQVAEGKKLKLLRALLGKVLGHLHASGRMTIWAKPR